jgi:hypothetical protein
MVVANYFICHVFSFPREQFFESNQARKHEGQFGHEESFSTQQEKRFESEDSDESTFEDDGSEQRSRVLHLTSTLDQRTFGVNA